MSTKPVGKPVEPEVMGAFGHYISLVTDPDIVSVLQSQLQATLALLEAIPEEKGGYRYAEGKWSIKELVGHIVDSERIFAYRALRFARNDQTELPGFDQDTLAANANFANLRLRDIIQEYEAVRRSTLLLLQHLDPDAWDRRGIANSSVLSVRAIAFAMAGHELHHLGILKERYI